ncbi:MAG TPA: OB-fold domain-containing protein [Nitrospinota bacterium]|nr:OB-fold domain-containing protein [Nitrospinota bacterium]
MTPEAGLSRNPEGAEAPEWVPRGCRCGACGRVFYPAKRICLTCERATEMQPVHLSRRGVLYTFTVIHVGLEGFRPPYAVGWIDLPEGVRLFAPLLSGDSETPFRIGTPMEMVLHPLPDERGELADGFAFQPIEGET